jgi:hypothetical protein
MDLFRALEELRFGKNPSARYSSSSSTGRLALARIFSATGAGT